MSVIKIYISRYGIKIKTNRTDGTTTMALLGEALASFHAAKLIDGMELHGCLPLLLLTQNVENKKTSKKTMRLCRDMCCQLLGPHLVASGARKAFGCMVDTSPLLLSHKIRAKLVFLISFNCAVTPKATVKKVECTGGNVLHSESDAHITKAIIRIYPS